MDGWLDGREWTRSIRFRACGKVVGPEGVTGCLEHNLIRATVVAGSND